MKLRCVALLFLVFALPVFAGETERKKLSEELLGLMKFERNMEQSFAVARQMQMAQLKNMALSDFDAAAAKEVREKTMDFMQQELSWKNLKDEFVAAYAEVFTEAELKALVDFYRTPTGAAYVDKVPQMMQRSSEITQRRMATIGPKVQQIIAEAAAKQKSLLPMVVAPRRAGAQTPEPEQSAPQK